MLVNLSVIEPDYVSHSVGLLMSMLCYNIVSVNFFY